MEIAKDQAEATLKDAKESQAAAVRVQDETQAERDNALAMVDSLRTAYAEELKRMNKE